MSSTSRQAGLEEIQDTDCSDENLIALAGDYPEEFLAHPRLAWMIIENPFVLSSLPAGVLAVLVATDRCPASFREWAVVYGSRSAHMALLRFGNPTAHDLERIALANHGRPAEIARARLLEMIKES
jgi:hypothetical protein